MSRPVLRLPLDFFRCLTRRSGGFQRSGQRPVTRNSEAAPFPSGLWRVRLSSSDGTGRKGESEKIGGVGWAAYCSLPTCAKSVFCSPLRSEAYPEQTSSLMVTMPGLGHGSWRVRPPSSTIGIRI